MNRHRQAAQRNQLARIVILTLGWALRASTLSLTFWGAKARAAARWHHDSLQLKSAPGSEWRWLLRLMVICLAASVMVCDRSGWLVKMDARSAATYTFSGSTSGNWTDTTRWSPSYPGTTINNGDTVIIAGFCLLNEDVINNGTWEVSSSGEVRVCCGGSLKNNNALTITGSMAGELNNAGTLTINGHYQLLGSPMLNTGTVINNNLLDLDLFSNGTLYNQGMLKNFGTLGHLLLVNNGTVELNVNTSIRGDFTNNALLISNSTLNLNGKLRNNSSGTVTCNGALNITYVLELYGGVLNNNDSMINSGTVELFGGGRLNNYTTLTNNKLIRIIGDGILSNPSGSTLTNNSDATLEILNGSDSHGLQNFGTLNNGGLIWIKSSSTLNHPSGGILNNYSQITVEGTGSLTNRSGATLNNQGNSRLEIKSSGTLHNYGSVTNSGTLIIDFNITSGRLNNNSGGTLTVASSGQLYIYGTLNNFGMLQNSGLLHNSGSISAFSTGLQNNASVVNNSDGTLTNIENLYNNSGGTLTNNGSMTSKGFLRNQGSLINNGLLVNHAGLSNESQLDNNSGATLNNLKNGSLQSTIFNYGTLTNAGTLNNFNSGVLENRGWLANSGSISNDATVTLKGGNITVSAPGTFTVGAAGIINRTSGHIIGNLTKTVSALGSYTFHTGTANGYAPVTVNFLLGTGNFTVSAAQPSLAGLVAAKSLQKYWTLTSDGITRANISVQYSDLDVPTGANEAAFVFFRKSGATLTNAGITTLDTTGNTATLNNVSQFSDWTLATAAAVPLVVTTTADENGVCDASCSLREAIAAAEAQPGDDAIIFAAGLTGTINLTGPLPALSGNLQINGPGAHLLTVRRNSGGDYRIFTINSGVTVAISGLTIANGKDGDCTGGGGVRNQGSLTIDQCAITGNVGCVGGGGIGNFGNLTINRSTISGNSIPGFGGGGIFNSAILKTGLFDGGTLTITNSTISGNSSHVGGGLENADNGTATITNCTINNNTSNLGGGVRNFSGTVQAKNSIFAGNSNGDFVSTLISQGYNLIQDASGATITGTTTGNQLGVNPLLAPLQNNGGPTATHALLCNSPAINAGDNTNAPATDQRGVARPISGTVDIGAFEANITLTINPSSLPNGTGGTTYNQSLTATGGATPYSFAVASGSLPNGLTLSTAGVLSGTPTANGDFTFTVIATDANGAQACRTYTVNIAAANTAPTFTPAAAISSQKGSPAALATVGTIADGETTAGSLTVTQIAGGTATGITVTGITNTNGLITAQVSASCSATSGTVRFQVSDGGLTSTGDLQVNVTANTAPTLTYAAVSVNAGNSTSNSPTTATDNGSITGYAIQSQGTYTGTINVNSSGVVSISLAAPVGSHTITIRATDNCGTTTDATFTLTIGNNLPTINAGAALSRQQGSAGSVSTIANVSDGETAAGSLIVTATTVPTGITVTSITNANGTIMANVAASCTATVGANTVVLTVTDGNSGTATANLTVNVTANSAPTLTYGNASVNAGTSTTNSPTTATDNGSITGYAVQSPGTYTGTINVNSSGVVSMSNAAPIGSHTIIIRATDNCGATTDASFTLTVNNNLPTITPGAALTRQQGTAGTVSPIATVGDADTAAGNLVVTATTVPTGITISSISNSNGTISANVTAGCNATIGINTIVLTVTDSNGGTNTANLTVNVTANTAPTLTYGSASVNAGSATSNSSTTASDNGSITGYAVQSQGTYTGTISVNSSGVVSISQAAPVGSHTITIRATDNCGVTTDATFILSVNNTAPTITAGAALSRPQGNAGTVSTMATVNDAETAVGNLTVTAITVPTGITVTSIVNTNGTITANVAATCAAAAGDQSVVLQVSDGSLTSTATLTVTVSVPAANHLAFGTHPSGAQTGATISPAVTVQVLNQCNLLMTSATNNITLALGNNPGGGTLNGTLTKAAMGGVATFNNLSLNKSGTGYTMTAANGGLTGTTSSAFNISCPTITLTPTSLPNPVAGTPYSQTLTASGGAPNYSFTVPPGSLPIGLSLAANGTLSGTPTQTGTFTFIVMATDANGCSGSRSYTLQIDCFTITLAPSSLPAGIVGAAYTNNLSASGGVGAYTFRIISGTAPTGLTLNANGTWSGTATAASTYNFTVEAKDTNGCTGTKVYQVVMNCPSLTLTPASLNTGVTGATYSQTLTPSGGGAPYIFNVTGLPSGLTANATASNVTLSGTPTQSGSFTVNVTVTNTYGCAGSQQLTLVINAPQPSPGDVRFSADFDGDGKADLVIWRPSAATFWVYTSGGITLSKQWGLSTDVPVLSDYDGDGKTDFAVWRPATGVWMICQSSNGATVTGQWGTSTDVPVPGDYDGDGKTDLAVWRPSNGMWLVFKSSTSAMMSMQWGAAGDVPVAGDYDGNGQTDLAVWRASTATFWIYSPATNIVTSKQWGVATDVPVPDDYDGDGKTDVAVWRPATATWIISQSTNGASVTGQWGNATDVPVPGDYDGDGKADLGVWRPATGVWWILRSSNGSTMTAQWGLMGDVPVS